MASLVPLHVKSHHSIGLGTASVSTLVQHAGRLGYGAFALTDLETLCGQVEFHVACRAAGLKAVTGVELRSGYRPGYSFGARQERWVLLASNARGYACLCQIVTQRRTSAARMELPLEALQAAGRDIYVLTDDATQLNRLSSVMNAQRLRALVVRPRGQSAAGERALITSARQLGVKLVADLDAELLESSDVPLQRLASAVRLRRTIAPFAEGGAARTFVAATEAERLFADLPDAVEETRRICDDCTFDLLRWPSEARATRDTAVLHDEVEQRCRARLQAPNDARRGAGSVYAERLATELHVLDALGLSDLFVTVAAISDLARARGISVAARGSAVSSLVLHLLGLSAIDPVQQGLYFERFVSTSRTTPPDIDLDVASQRREELIEAVMLWRGPGRAVRPCSVNRFQRRSAHRAGLEALGTPPDVITNFLRGFPPDELEGHAAASLQNARLPPPWREQLGTIARLMGMPRHLALHPGGIVLCESSVSEGLPLERHRAGGDICQYDAESITHLRLPKIDLLGNHCLDEIDATLASARARVGLSPAIGSEHWLTGNFALDDAETLTLIDRAETLGCYQIESPSVRRVLASQPIHSLDDLTHALAIVRPGAASGRAKDDFLARARGEATLPELPAPLRERLRPTYGVLLYEEDIIFTLAAMTGISLEDAEALRVRLGERDDLDWSERAGQRFIRAARERGVDAASAEAVWSSVVRFAAYSFNKAHAASQALLAYRAAYLKCHARLEFGCALLNHHGGLYPRRVIAAELIRGHVALLLPSILASEVECTLEAASKGGAIRIGLGLIKGLRAASRARLLARRGALRAEPDREALLLSQELSVRELRALVWCGACDDALGLVAGDYPWVHEAVLQRLEGALCEPLGEVIASARARAPSHPAELVERYRRLSRIQNELRYLQMHVSDHPLRVLRSEADHQGCLPSNRLREHVGQKVRVAGVVAAARSVPLNVREVAQFLTFEDEHGLIEARLPADAYARLHGAISTPGPFLIEGYVHESHGALQLIVRELIPFHQRFDEAPTDSLRERL